MSEQHDELAELREENELLTKMVRTLEARLSAQQHQHEAAITQMHRDRARPGYFDQDYRVYMSITGPDGTAWAIDNRVARQLADRDNVECLFFACERAARELVAGWATKAKP